jgi:hypothetical protein
MKSFIEIMNKKPNSKAEILFYKLYPKWKNHKSWDFLRSVEYPIKKDVRPGPDFSA